MIRQNAGQRIFMVGCSAGDDHMECSSMSEGTEMLRFSSKYCGTNSSRFGDISI